MPAVAVASVEVHPLAVCCWCGASFMRGPSVVTVTHPERPYPWVCPVHWGRQMAAAMVVDVKGRGGRQTRFVPLPRQVEAVDALHGRYQPFVDAAFMDPTYILIGGAAGGSKSKGLREIAHAECMRTPGFRVLLLRRTYKELDQTHIRDAEIEAPEMGAVAVPSAKLVRYPNGSTLQFGHCETSADAANYLSAEYDLIIFDELVTFEELQFLLISSRARSTKPGVRPKVLAGTNPGGPQAHWVRSRFIDKSVDRTEYPDYDPNDYCYIPSKLDDNPYLDQAYEKKLLSLPPELRRAYRDGDWDVFPGQYFPEFRKTHRVEKTDAVLLAKGFTEGQDIPWHVDRLTVPGGTGYVLAIDWGYYPDPGVCLWIALLPDGRAYVEDEYVFLRTLDKTVAQNIARRTQEMGIRVRYAVGDTQMWTPNTSTGQSIAETFAAHGVSMLQADKERVNGWQRLRDWFAPSETMGTPWMVVSPRCTYTARTVPSLVMDARNVLDVDSDGEDHAADPLRYFASSRPAAGAAKTAVVYPPNSVGALIKQATKKLSKHARWRRVA